MVRVLCKRRDMIHGAHGAGRRVGRGDEGWLKTSLNDRCAPRSARNAVSVDSFRCDGALLHRRQEGEGRLHWASLDGNGKLALAPVSLCRSRHRQVASLLLRELAASISET